MLTGLFVFSLAQAAVIKPGESTDEAWSQELVDDHTFNYSVSDYGWRTVGTIDGSSGEKTAIKGLAIRYSLAETEVDRKLSAQTASRLTLDAVSKCAELGAMEELEQRKPFPADTKVEVQARVITSVIYESVGNAGFSCSLSLSIKRN